MKRFCLKDLLHEYHQLIPSIIAFIVVLFILIIISVPLNMYKDINFWNGFLVEAHGLLLDILVIGIIVFFLQLKKIKISKYVICLMKPDIMKIIII